MSEEVTDFTICLIKKVIGVWEKALKVIHSNLETKWCEKIVLQVIDKKTNLPNINTIK